MDLAGSERQFYIGAGDSFSVSYPVLITSLGDVDIKIEAQTETAYDAMIRTVHVKVNQFCIIVTNYYKSYVLYSIVKQHARYFLLF